MKKENIALFFIGCVLLYANLFFITRQSLVFYTPKQEEIASGGITVTNENINRGSEQLTIDICRPIVSGFGDFRFEQTLNEAIEKQIMLALKQAEQEADIFWKDTKAKGYEPWAYVFYAGYEVKTVSGIFSLKVTTLLNTGGTGMPHTVYYNADIKRNRFLCLEDLFKKDSSYKEIIDSYLKKEMDKDPERFFAADNFSGITKDTQFFIYEGALYIALAKYEIASGMTGEPQFLIPAEIMREFLRPEYKNIIK